MKIQFPQMYRVRQKFDDAKIENIEQTVVDELSKLGLGSAIKAGESVAITVGSRGISNIDVITKAIVDFLKGIGAKPFIVPAMGSHGGGTVEGQLAVLTGYGVTESSMGVEIRASMETVIVDTTSQGIPVHFDKKAYEADHVFVAGRIKPHTRFVGDIESGLYKMMLIGLGKHEGAKVYHKAIEAYNFEEIIQSIAKSVLEKCGIVAGLGIVENAYDETCVLEAVRPADFYEREKMLLEEAKKRMPRLPFKNVDLLIVDQIGKNISGSGLDAGLVGRKYHDHEFTEKDSAAIKRIFVRGLTKETQGNALGIGIAEFTNTRTVAGVDWEKSRINAITASHPTVVMIPISFETDSECVDAALQTIGLVEPENSKILHISDTLHISEVLLSETHLEEIKKRDDLEIIDGPMDFAFDEDGNLKSVL